MSHDNPYQPPAVAVHDAVVVDPNARLYSLRGIGLGVFFGSLLAGGVLIARNYRALGEPVKARNALVWSLLGTLVLFALVYTFPEQVPGLAFVIVQIVVIVSLASKLQGPAIRALEAQGAQMRSNWSAVGISLLISLGMLAILLLVALLAPESWQL